MKVQTHILGVWGPGCVQHGFTDEFSFSDDKYRVPSGTGMKADEAITQFLKDPENAPWLLDEGVWPATNEGCNGLSRLNLKS